MPSHHAAGLLVALASPPLVCGATSAHPVAGNRIVPAMLAIDDPGASDELAPQVKAKPAATVAGSLISLKGHTMPTFPFRRGSRVAASALLLALVTTGHALAHAHLLSSTPAAKGMAMPAPTELQLQFSEGLELKFTKVTITGPDKAVVRTGPAKLGPKDNSLLIVPLAGPLADGTYKVDWQALATDGHKTKGSYHFDAMQ